MTISGPGFNTSYRVSPCGGLVTSPQTLTSPNYPSHYGVGIDCVWLIDLSELGQQVQLTVDDVQLESDSDCVTVLNGHLPSSPQVAKFCGASASRPSSPIRSQSSYLLIIFRGDSVGNSGRGVSMTVDGVAAGCGGILHSRTGNLASPNYPSAYAADIECEWEIRVEPGYKVLASFYQRFDLENSTDCRNDFIELLDWKNENWQSLGRFCGKQLPPVVSSSGPVIKVLFRTNSQYQGDGFRVSFIQLFIGFNRMN